MARAWETLDTADTPDGALKLLRRGEADFLITVDGRVLMNSQASRSERVLAERACGAIPASPEPRVLIGGLGMGCTVRAALDTLPADAQLLVAELHPKVVEWCRGPLAGLNENALSDPRLQLEIGDVAARIRAVAVEPATPRYDAIVIDLFEGPHAATDPVADPFYGARALAHTRQALRAGGVFAVWSEDRDAGFESRLKGEGFELESLRPGRGGRRHAVYLARSPG